MGYHDFAGECKYRLLVHRKETDKWGVKRRGFVGYWGKWGEGVCFQ